MTGIIVQPAEIGPKKESSAAVSVSELFHENTKLQPSLPADMIAAGSYTDAEIQAMSRGFKQYKLFPQIPLPSREEWSPVKRSYDDVIESRRSVREFSDCEMKLEDLSRVLHQSYGITGEIRRPEDGTLPLRAAPSGGALYPAEIYLGIRNVSGLQPGIYHYNVPDHALELLISGDPASSLFEICCGQKYVRQAAATVLISGVLQRTKRKYGERGYRYVLLDIGHLGQNIYLACTALDLAVMTTCGFYDDRANQLLSLDGIQETMMYVAFLGPRN